MYHELIRDYPNDQLSIRGRSGKQFDDARFLALDCVRLPTDYIQHFTFSINQEGHETDLLANNLSWHIVSAKTREVMERALGGHAEEHIQFLEVSPRTTRMRYAFGTYYLLNILKCISCLNWDQSDIVWEKNDVGELYISHAHEIVLDRSRIPQEAKLFRVQEYKGYVIIETSLVEALQIEGISAFSVAPIRTV